MKLYEVKSKLIDWQVMLESEDQVLLAEYVEPSKKSTLLLLTNRIKKPKKSVVEIELTQDFMVQPYDHLIEVVLSSYQKWSQYSPNVEITLTSSMVLEGFNKIYQAAVGVKNKDKPEYEKAAQSIVEEIQSMIDQLIEDFFKRFENDLEYFEILSQEEVSTLNANNQKSSEIMQDIRQNPMTASQFAYAASPVGAIAVIDPRAIELEAIDSINSTILFGGKKKIMGLLKNIQLESSTFSVNYPKQNKKLTNDNYQFLQKCYNLCTDEIKDKKQSLKKSILENYSPEPKPRNDLSPVS